MQTFSLVVFLFFVSYYFCSVYLSDFGSSLAFLSFGNCGLDTRIHKGIPVLRGKGFLLFYFHIFANVVVDVDCANCLPSVVSRSS